MSDCLGENNSYGGRFEYRAKGLKEVYTRNLLKTFSN